MFVLSNPENILLSLLEVIEVRETAKQEIKEVKKINVFKNSIQSVEKELIIKENKDILNACKKRKKDILKFFNNSQAMN